MKDTCGRRGSASSKSAVLQLYLENRLRTLMASRGSTLYRLTWKQRVTPSGRLICALRASAPRTSDSVFSSWPSPMSNDARDSTHTYDRGDHSKPRLKLPGAAKLVGWATPAANEAGGTPERFIERKRRARANGSILGLSLTSLKLQATGAKPNGSSASTVKAGQLNPAHSRWLMGYPRAWDDCAPTETRSSRKSRQRSSEL